MAYARRDIRGGAVQTTISSGITNSDTTIAIAASTGWPDGSGTKPFYVVIDPGLSSEEKVLCASRTSLSLTVTTRGADGSTASSHASGAVIYPIISAVDIDEANYAVSQTVGTVTAAGDLLVASGTNAFTRLAKGSSSRVLAVDSGGTLGYTTVTAAMAAADMATQAELDAHINDTSDAHDASAVSFSPAGTIASTDVQAAIEEASGDLTTHEAATTSVHGITDTSTLVVNTRQVISGGGLTGGGDLSADRTLAVGAGTGITVAADAVAVDSALVDLGAASTTWTVTFRGTSGTIGNGTTDKRWYRTGRLIHFSLTFVAGSTTNWGTNHCILDLPVAAQDPGSFLQAIAYGWWHEASSGNNVPVVAYLDPDNDTANDRMRVDYLAGPFDLPVYAALTNAAPAAVASGDQVHLHGWYFAAS